MKDERMYEQSSEEIQKLQETLAWSLEEVQRLRKENELLSRQAEKKQALQTVNTAAEQEVKLLRIQGRKLSQQVQTANYRLTRLQTQYDALAGSKLGRLTLHYWAWKKKNQGKGKLGTAVGFIMRWLFNRLPEVSIIDLEEGQYQLLKEEEKPALEANKPAEKPAPKEEVQPTQLVMSQEQETWIDSYMERIAAIPDSNGCRYYEKLPYRIGLICDEFFYESISAAADFVFLTPDNWQEELEKGLDVMLFVSAWRGLHNEWFGLASLTNRDANPVRKAAFDLLQACADKKIPTVFYSKEDPPSYEVFLDYARQCDYIFTSARECAPYYEEECGREHVGAVCFGINPLAHNPIGFRTAEKEKTVLFSGSWMKKFPDRCRDLAVIFDGILDSGYGLHVIDRNYPANKNYMFPEKYFPYVSPALPHDVLQKVHKLFDWAVNINSVKGSETMFANRNFELQANGVLLMSNSSVGLNSMLPTVHLVHDSTEVASILGCLSDEERYEKQITGIRSVMTNHTCFDRLAQLLEPTGLATAQPMRRVLVICDEQTDAVRESFERQTYQEKVLLQADAVTEEVLSQYDMVTWFASDAAYGIFYLEDMINGFKYTACDYITKDAWQESGVLHDGTEHNYVSHMGSKYRTVFWREAFTAEFLLNLSGAAELPNGYSMDHFNYDAAPVMPAEQQKKYLLSVVVPVYNNGLHLYGKCFSSLRRSSMFQDMEIILVDDGSTDAYTLKIEDYLLQTYDNVRSFRFGDGGSGSASRPRNKGVELATAEHVAFLDPDNEAVCDGYASLYDTVIENHCDLALGDMYKCDVSNRSMKYYEQIVKAAGTDSFDEGIGELLIQSNFIAPSIQAMVMRTDLLRSNGLKQVEGAIGEDTLFAWQLLDSAKRIRVLDLPIHIYYAQTAGSVTNVLKANFFRKTLLVQQPKVQWLVQHGLIEKYMEQKHNYYTKFWILKKLSLAVEADAPECAALTEQILDAFAPYYHNTDPLLNTFLEHCKRKEYAEAAACARKTFPLHAVRPMPTWEEILAPTRKVAKQKVEYVQNGNVFTFYNQSGKEGSSFAWVILLDSAKYEKVYATKYSWSPEFTYDFTGKEPRMYKVRAFLKNGEDKISDDVAFIEVTSKGEAVLNSKQSFVTLKK